MNEWMDGWLLSCFSSKLLPGWHVSWTPHPPFPCDFGTPRTDVQAGSKCTHQLWHRGGGKPSPTCNPSGSRSWASTESLAQPAPNWDQIISITTQNSPKKKMEPNQPNRLACSCNCYSWNKQHAAVVVVLCIPNTVKPSKVSRLGQFL